MLDETGAKYLDTKGDGNDEAQADMCEIVRTLLFTFEPDLVQNKKIYDYSSFGLGPIERKMQNFVRYLNCYGEIPGTRICAINPRDFSDQEQWWILFGGDTIKVHGHPEV